MNKKKKREETKQKNKYEKNKLNNFNNQNHYNYYPGMYMPPMQINNQNPAYYNEYQNYFYLNPASYPMGQQIMGTPYYPQFLMSQNTLEDTINMIYNRGIVNNIIGAFFIKECQERQKNAEKKRVPISKVELNDEIDNISKKYKEEKNSINSGNIGFKNENVLDKEDKEIFKEKKEEGKEEKKERKTEQKKDNELIILKMV